MTFHKFHREVVSHIQYEINRYTVNHWNDGKRHTHTLESETKKNNEIMENEICILTSENGQNRFIRRNEKEKKIYIKFMNIFNFVWAINIYMQIERIKTNMAIIQIGFSPLSRRHFICWNSWLSLVASWSYHHSAYPYLWGAHNSYHFDLFRVLFSSHMCACLQFFFFKNIVIQIYALFSIRFL